MLSFKENNPPGEKNKFVSAPKSGHLNLVFLEMNRNEKFKCRPTETGWYFSL